MSVFFGNNDDPAPPVTPRPPPRRQYRDVLVESGLGDWQDASEIYVAVMCVYWRVQEAAARTGDGVAEALLDKAASRLLDATTPLRMLVKGEAFKAAGEEPRPKKRKPRKGRRK